MKEILLPLMMWMSGQTGVPLESVPEPVIIQKSADDLYRIYFQKDPIPGDTNRFNPMMLFLEESDTILVGPECEFGTIKCNSFLINELTHLFQMYSGKTYKCKGDRERESWDMQEKWLEEQGWSLFKDNTDRPSLNMDILVAVGESMCINPNMAKPGEMGS